MRGVEKVIGEFKIVETEEGYRIEIKFGFGRGFWGEMGPWCCWWEEEKEGSE